MSKNNGIAGLSVTWFNQFAKTMNQSALDSAKGEIVMYQPDETIRLEVRMEDETVWLN